MCAGEVTKREKKKKLDYYILGGMAVGWVGKQEYFCLTPIFLFLSDTRNLGYCSPLIPAISNAQPKPCGVENKKQAQAFKR